MPATYEPISTYTFTSTDYTYTISSIPSTYTDLRLVVAGASNGNNNIGLQFNGDNSSIYSRTAMFGAASPGSERSTNTDNISIGTLSTTPALVTADIFSYTDAVNKTVLTTFSNDTNGGGTVRRGVGLWRSNSTINSIKVISWFTSGVTITLYGIKNA